MVGHGLGEDTDINVDVDVDNDNDVTLESLPSSSPSVTSAAGVTVWPMETLSNDGIVVSVGVVGVVVGVGGVDGHNDRSTYCVSSSKNLGTLYKMTKTATGIKNIQAFGLYLQQQNFRC